MRRPEILAPAGSREALLAGLRCGADAVYVGAKQYSARGSAQNFDLHELEAAAELCHLYHAKLYLTVNTLVTDRELQAFAVFIRQAAACGIDACIVQDLGVLHLIHEMIPDMPLHASTQMSIHTPEGVLQAKALGCSRVVLARELSCAAIQACCALPIETEVFVHGALCMSVSGQCSFSAIVGGRSANRGHCAQACRLPWHIPGSEVQAALSLKDVSLAEHVRQLQAMGVDSFKIEGRMKRPEYVAAAVTAFRAALDGQQPDMALLQSVFSRSGFTDGYFTGKQQSMFGFRRKEDVLAGQQVFSRIQESYRKPGTAAAVDFVLRLQDGQPALLEATDSDGNHVLLQGDIPAHALKKPMDAQTLQKYLCKLGDTVYCCRNVELKNPDYLLLSAAQCNALRRDAVEALNALRKKKPVYRIEHYPEYKSLHHAGSIPDVPLQRLHVRTKAQLQVALQTEAVICLSPEMAVHTTPSASLWLEAPRIIADEQAYKKKLDMLYQKGWRHLLCHNLADIAIGKKAGFLLHGGFGLNCTNTMTAYSLLAQGVQDVTASYELRAGAIASIAGAVPCGAYLYGRLPMMLLRLCPIKAQCGCRKQQKTPGNPQKSGSCLLTDRTGRKFPLFCHGNAGYTELCNSEVVFLPDKLDAFGSLAFRDYYFTDESAAQMQQVLDIYHNHDKSHHHCLYPDTVHRTNGLYFSKGGLS